MTNNFLKNKNVVNLIEIFKEKNHQLFMVGGAVRDIVMGNEADDFDFATSAKPSQMLVWGELDNKLHSEKIKIVDTGSKFGTVTFVFPNGETFEVTTFRKDITLGRHPKVEFSDTILEDLKRRDLTINAMAINLIDCNHDENIFNLIDPFNGIFDINNNIIKFVGIPQNRIKEDPLRMLRALRFAGKFNFKIDTRTMHAIKVKRELISNVSSERIFMEIIKSAKFETGFSNFIFNLEKLGLFDIIDKNFSIMKKTIQNKWHAWNVFVHTNIALHNVETINNCELADFIKNNSFIFRNIKANKVNVKLGVLFHDIGKPSVKFIDKNTNTIHFHGHEKVGSEIAKQSLKKLKVNNKLIERIQFLIKNHMRFKDSVPPKNKTVLRFLRKNNLNIFDDDNDMQLFLELIEVIHADSNALGTNFDDKDAGINILKVIVDIFNNNKNIESNISNNLAINGKDIMNILNLKPSKKIGEIKNTLIDIVIDNPELNNRKSLIDAMTNIVNKEK